MSAPEDDRGDAASASAGAPPPRYPYVALDVDAERAEDTTALLFELGAAGVEQRDATTLARGAAGKVTLIAAFERADEARAAAAGLPAGCAPRVEEIVGDAWRDEWKKHFEPFTLADGIVVSPPWRSYEPGPGERVIVLEPGRAFGTGLHETTALVAGVLADRAAIVRGRHVLDVGCGSGVLSLAAVALGASRARAIDVDPEAVLVTRENALRNGMSARVLADDTPLGAIEDRYAVVVANIEARTLVDLAPALVGRVDRGGLLVLSGILAADTAPGQLEDVRRAYAALRCDEVRRKGEWVCVVAGG